MGFRFRHRRPKKKPTNKERKQRIRETSIKDLPVDISLNILKRLPITSLFSVKSVSKAFYHLASHPTLTPHWLIIRIPPSKKLSLIDDRGVLRKVTQPMIKKKLKAGPVLSCDGLLCLLYYRYKHPCLDYYRACLFNPLIGEHDFLPDLVLPRLPESSHKGTLVSSEQVFGFGFDARTKEYKLVRIVMVTYEVATYLKAEVFILGKKGRRFSKFEPEFVCPYQSSDVGVSGAIHWLCEDLSPTSVDPKSRIIVSFDLFEEKFHQVSKPEIKINESCKISVLGECLAITGDFSKHHGRHEVHIWVLKEYGVKESWTKEYVIGERFGRLYPLLLLNSGNIVMSDESKTVCCYDPKRDSSEVYVELDQPIVAIHHVPSLVSPFF